MTHPLFRGYAQIIIYLCSKLYYETHYVVSEKDLLLRKL